MSPKRAVTPLICCALFLVMCAGLIHTKFSAAKAFPALTDDNRSADREAIRSHIEKIFKAYVERDCATIRATHSQNWIGFTGSARSVMRGLDDYMNNSARFCQQKDLNQQAGISGYKLTDIDYLFRGDVALVPYVAETTYGRGAVVHGKLRSLDIYAKENGEWIQIGSNIFLHPDTVQAQMQQPRPLTVPERQSLMETREAVWRAFFANDQAQLDKLIPKEAMYVSESKQEPIVERAGIFEAARKTAETGSKLVRLDFPRTETQYYGSTAILYTTYLVEMENARGERRTQTGRGTEIFVRRDNGWVNAGWQLQSDR